MNPIVSGGASFTYRPVMIFIDGAYLRKGIINLGLDDEKISYSSLADFLSSSTDHGLLKGDMIRAYYYDAIVGAKEDKEEHINQDKYFKWIRKSTRFYEVKLGRLNKSGKKNESYKQKGVDTLIAIDMITKAYENQYSIAVLVAGDDDFADVVTAVKNTGKRVYGVFFENEVSSNLKEAYDVHIPLKLNILNDRGIMLKEKDELFNDQMKSQSTSPSQPTSPSK